MAGKNRKSLRRWSKVNSRIMMKRTRVLCRLTCLGSYHPSKTGLNESVCINVVHQHYNLSPSPIRCLSRNHSEMMLACAARVKQAAIILWHKCTIINFQTITNLGWMSNVVSVTLDGPALSHRCVLPPRLFSKLAKAEALITHRNSASTKSISTSRKISFQTATSARSRTEKPQRVPVQAAADPRQSFNSRQRPTTICRWCCKLRKIYHVSACPAIICSPIVALLRTSRLSRNARECTLSKTSLP